MNSDVRPAAIQKNVAMLHTARCGSTVLVYMLGDHSKVYWGSEIFMPHMKTDPATHPKNLMKVTLRESESHCTKGIHGFEIKYLSYQHLSEKCLNMSLEECISGLRKLGVTHFIGMHRRNHLRRFISLKVGMKKGYWHAYQKEEKQENPEMVQINVKFPRGRKLKGSLVDVFDHVDRSYEQLKECLPAGSLFLTYEDDVQDDPRVGYRKICDFIGIEDEHPEIILKHQPLSLREDGIQLC